MALETATYIAQLNSANPVGGDGIPDGDNHIRMIKSVLQAQFPNLGVGACTPTYTEINYLVGVTSAIQTQLNAKLAQTNPTPTSSGSDLTSLGWESALTLPTGSGVITFDSGVVGAGRYGFTGITSTDGNWYFGRTQLNNGTTAPTYAMWIGNDGKVTVNVQAVLPANTAIGSVTSTEIGYLSGVSSAIQTQLNAKAGTSSPVFTNYAYINATAGNTASVEIAGNGNGQGSGVSINQNSSNDLVIYNRQNAAIIFGTNNTTQWIVDASGRLRNTSGVQPSFRAEATSNLTALSASATIVFNSELHDQGSVYNNSTGVFTAPVSGVYFFSASVMYFNTAGFAVNGDGIYLKKNSTAVAYGVNSYPNNYSASANVSQTLSLSQNDTVQVCVVGATTANFYPQGSTAGGVVFSGHLLG